MTKDRMNDLKNGLLVKKTPNSRHQVVINVEDEEKYSDEQTCLTLQDTKPVIVKTKNNKNEAVLKEIFKKVNEINDIINGMQESVASLKKIHIAMQHATRADSDTRDKCEDLMEDFKSSGMEAKSKVKELEKFKTANVESAINRVICTQNEVLNRILQNTVDDYQKCLVDHKQRHEAIIKTQLKIVVEKVIRRIGCFPANVQVSDDELLAMLDSQDTAIFVDHYIKDTAEAIQMLQDAKVRHKEILAIEKSIEEIRDMFFEIAFQLSEQGELVDTIEYHIGNGMNMTKRGQKKLSKAEIKSKKVRKKKIYLAGIVTLVLLVFIFFSILLA